MQSENKPFIILLTPFKEDITLAMPVVDLLVKEFFTFYVTVRLITVVTAACHLFLTSASWVQSAYSHPVSLRSILISTCLCLGLLSAFFPSSFPTKISCAFPASPVHALRILQAQQCKIINLRYVTSKHKC